MKEYVFNLFHLSNIGSIDVVLNRIKNTPSTEVDIGHVPVFHLPYEFIEVTKPRNRIVLALNL